MLPFSHVDNELNCEQVPLSRIAQAVGTPAYIYSATTLDSRCEILKKAFESYPTLICFAVKANHNLSVLKRVFGHGLGADVVSVGELERALKAGVSPERVVFSGVGKTDAEISAAIQRGIYSFNVESPYELGRLAALAASAKSPVGISLRINPNIDVKTNPYIATGLYTTKFGIAEQDLAPLLATLKNHKQLRLLGLACHIGSQITELGPFREAVTRLVQLTRDLSSQGFRPECVNLGGGLGIPYRGEAVPSANEYGETLLKALEGTGLRLLIEPGRSLVGEMGALLTRVIQVKKTPKKTFVVVDAAMNDLIRPSLYDAYHAIEPVKKSGAKSSVVDVVGPVCETGDFLGLDRELPELSSGDLLLVRSCGAYGATMASNYNTRPRAPEVLVENGDFRVVRRRERLQDLWALEGG